MPYLFIFGNHFWLLKEKYLLISAGKSNWNFHVSLNNYVDFFQEILKKSIKILDDQLSHSYIIMTVKVSHIPFPHEIREYLFIKKVTVKYLNEEASFSMIYVQ